MVIGEGEKHTAAFIMPAEDGLKFWCQKHNIIFSNMKEVLLNRNVLEKYTKEIEHYNNFFSPYERIKKFELIAEPWSVDGGELTATMKLRRKNIMMKYQDLSDKIYKENN